MGFLFRWPHTHHIKDKPNPTGVEVMVVTESPNGYMLGAYIYTKSEYLDCCWSGKDGEWYFGIVEHMITCAVRDCAGDPTAPPATRDPAYHDYDDSEFIIYADNR